MKLILHNVKTMFKRVLNGIKGLENKTDKMSDKLTTTTSIARSASSNVSRLNDELNWMSGRFETRPSMYTAPGSLSDIHSICYGDGKFIAIGTNKIYFSSDGSEWENKNIANAFTSNAISGVTYGNGIFLVYTSDGLCCTNNNLRGYWNETSIPFTPYHICYGLGLFIAISNGSYVYTSVDGVIWNKSDETLPYSVTSDKDTIHFLHDRFIISKYGTDDIMYSLDGKTWVTCQLPVISTFRSFAYGNGWYVGVDENFSYWVYSTDGTNWSYGRWGEQYQIPNASITFGNGKFVITGQSEYCHTSKGGNSISANRPCSPSKLTVYGNGRFLSISNDENWQYVTYSLDGDHWYDTTWIINLDNHGEITPVLKDIFSTSSLRIGDGGHLGMPYRAFTPTYSITVNGRTTILNYNKNGPVIYTDDGFNWRTGTKIPALMTNPIAYGNGKYISMSADSSRFIYESTDGINWITGYGGLTNFTSNASIAYGNGIFVVTDNKGSIATSSDGRSWKQTEYGSYTDTGARTILVYDGRRFINILGARSILSYSEDGITWTETTLPISGNYRTNFAYGNGVYILNHGSYTCISSNGIDWEPITNISIGSALWFVNGKFITPKSVSGWYKYSEDGYNWTDFYIDLSYSATHMLYCDGKYIAINPTKSNNSNQIAYSYNLKDWYFYEKRIYQDNTDVTDLLRNTLIDNTPKTIMLELDGWDSFKGIITLGDIEVELTHEPVEDYYYVHNARVYELAKRLILSGAPIYNRYTSDNNEYVDLTPANSNLVVADYYCRIGNISIYKE